MSVKNIIDYPITDSVFITVFSERASTTMSLSRGGTVVFEGKYVATEFSNKSKSFKNHELLGYIGKSNFEAKAKKFLDSIKYEYNGAATDTIVDYLKSQNYPFSDNHNIWVIVPKPDKKPTGNKFVITFERLPNETFEKRKFVDYDLDVYMTKIDSKTKKVVFRVDIPEHIYNMCMKNPDLDNRLSLKYIESENLSDLHSKMSDYANLSSHVSELLKASEMYKKKICIVFNSKETTERDSYYFAYLGQRISTNFGWYIAYEYETKDFSGRPKKEYFTWKKNMSTGTTIGEFRGYTGVVDFEKKGIKTHIHTKPPGVIVDWTQEREDFLTALENKFRNLSENLNEFLADLDDDKIEKLITSSMGNKLLNS
jgi:hypothetical protein